MGCIYWSIDIFWYLNYLLNFLDNFFLNDAVNIFVYLCGSEIRLSFFRRMCFFNLSFLISGARHTLCFFIFKILNYKKISNQSFVSFNFRAFGSNCTFHFFSSLNKINSSDLLSQSIYSLSHFLKITRYWLYSSTTASELSLNFKNVIFTLKHFNHFLYKCKN